MMLVFKFSAVYLTGLVFFVVRVRQVHFQDGWSCWTVCRQLSSIFVLYYCACHQ